MPQRVAWSLVLSATLLRLVVVMALFVLLFMALIHGAFAAGNEFATPPNYLDPGHCPQPCWQGLRPGYTRAEDVRIFLVENWLVDYQQEIIDEPDYFGWQTRRWPSYDVQAHLWGGVLLSLQLNVDGGLMLGDVLPVYGTPSHSENCPFFITTVNNRSAAFATLYFYDGAVQVSAYFPNALGERIRPDMQVHSIRYRTLNTPDDESWVPLGTAEWHGFGLAQYDRGCQR